MHMPPRGSHWKRIERIWEGVHQAMTREPGDLPAHRSLLPGPGDGHGTVTLPSERRSCAAGAASVRGNGCFVAPARRRTPTGNLPASPA